ncbi:MAG: hypothetical protein Athens071424_178, partial [Parcubacteria group bacterium Athens0714_24]
MRLFIFNKKVSVSSIFFLFFIFSWLFLFIPKALAQVCPVGSVIVADNTLAVTETTTVSAPAGFTGGYFEAVPPFRSISIGGSTVTAVEYDPSFMGVMGKGWTYTPNGATNCELAVSIIIIYDYEPYASPLTQTAFGLGNSVYYDVGVSGLLSFPYIVTLNVGKAGGSQSLQFDIEGDAFGYQSSVSAQGTPGFIRWLAVYGAGGTIPDLNTIYARAVYNGHQHELLFDFRVEPEPSAPDLVVQSLSPTSATVGQVVTFSGTVRNSGDASAGATSQTRFRLDIGNNGSWDVNPSNQSTGNLSDGATEVETWNNVWTAVAGTHKYEICADVTGTVTESDEGNNCTSQTFTVACTPLTYRSATSGFSTSATGPAASSLAVYPGQTFYAFVDYGVQHGGIQAPNVPGSYTCTWDNYWLGT